MMLCVSGDTHGATNRLYAEVVAFEGALGARFDHILRVGDFDVWPDPSRVVGKLEVGPQIEPCRRSTAAPRARRVVEC